MPNITITPKTNLVYVDGYSKNIDCSQVASFFHAINWYGNANPPYGEIEFVRDVNNKPTPNLRIVDFSPFQYLKDAWDAHVVPTEIPNPNPPTPENN